MSNPAYNTERHKSDDHNTDGYKTDGHGQAAGSSPHVVLPVLLDELPAVLDQVAIVLEPAWPDYAAFLVQERERVIAPGQLALRQIVAAAESALSGDEHDVPGGASDGGLPLFEQIGREQSRQGHNLDSLLSAYQAGARVFWRQMAQRAVEHNVSAPAVALLADAVFGFVNHLSAASTHGYLEEQSAAASDRERARQDLSELLLSDRSDRQLIEAVAQRARWPLPPTVAVVLLADAGVALDVLLRLGAGTLPVRREDAVGALVPDPAGPARREWLAATFKGVGAVIGPAVPLEQLPAALRITQVAARLLREGVLDAQPLFVDENLDALIVHRDSRMLEALQTRVLAPLAPLPAEARDRLRRTLVSWLEHLGDRQQVAADLHIHRQTVRYRMTQLQELFGVALDDPRFRAKLMLALSWQPNGPAIDPVDSSAATVRAVRNYPT